MHPSIAINSPMYKLHGQILTIHWATGLILHQLIQFWKFSG